MTSLDGYVDARKETPEAMAFLILEKLQIVKSRKETSLESSRSHGEEAKPGADGRAPERPLAASQSKVVASVEALWKSVNVCQEVLSGAMTTLGLLTAQELDDVFHGRRVGNGMAEYMLEEYRDVTFIGDKRDRIRAPLTGAEELFVSERLWELYGRIVQIHGRMAFLFHRSFESSSYIDWRKNEPTVLMMSVLGRHAVGGSHVADYWRDERRGRVAEWRVRQRGSKADFAAHSAVTRIWKPTHCHGKVASPTDVGHVFCRGGARRLP